MSHSPASHSPASQPPADVTPGMTRRVFEHSMLGLIPLVYGAGEAFVSVAYMLPFGKRRRPKLDVGPTGEFDGELVKEVAFNEDDVYVLRSDDGIQAFKRKCPHLDCAISWRTGDNIFECPCHGMTWQRNGKFIKGPVEKDIRPQAFEIKGDRVVLLDEPASES